MIIPSARDFEKHYPKLYKELGHVPEKSELDVMRRWKCSSCGMPWPATIRDRMGGQDCPYCTEKNVSDVVKSATVWPNEL